MLSFRLLKQRVALIELLYLAKRAPAQVAGTRVSEINRCHFVQASLEIKPGRQLAGNALVLHKRVLVCRTDGILVGAHGVQITTFNSGELGRNQSALVEERRRTIL